MKILHEEIRLETGGQSDIVDLTGASREKLKKSKLTDGTATFFVVGSTAALTTAEFEPGLAADLKDLFEKLIPQKNASYHHDATWGDANGFSHLRASLLGPSLVVPFKDGDFCLGQWQQVVLIDFDNRPRSRCVVLQFQGR